MFTEIYLLVIFFFLKEKNTKIKDVVIMQYDKAGKVFLQTKKNGKTVFNAKLGIVKKVESEVQNEN